MVVGSPQSAGHLSRQPFSAARRGLFELLAAGGQDGTIRLYDLANQQSRALGHVGQVTNLTFTPDGASLVSVGSDRAVKVWDVAPAGATVVQASSTPMWSLALSADGATAYSIDNEALRSWDTRTGQQRYSLPKHGGLAVALSPDGKLLAAERVQVTLHDAQTGQPLRKLYDAGHGKSFWSLAFSPDGKTLYGGCQDYSTHVWNVESGAESEPLLARDNGCAPWPSLPTAIHWPPATAMVRSTCWILARNTVAAHCGRIASNSSA
jgi:WD40 repeat protein